MLIVPVPPELRQPLLPLPTDPITDPLPEAVVEDAVELGLSLPPGL